jgi:Acyl-CoA dehydrogenase, C-terminal domain
VDAVELDLLAGSLRAAMAAGPAGLPGRLAALGWPELLVEAAGQAVPLVFRLLGETGAAAPVLNDVLLHAAGRPPGRTVPMPYAGGGWVVWVDGGAGAGIDPGLGLRPVPAGEPVPLAAGRLALGWWLVGCGHAMLALARAHALERTQFGRPLAGFQAVRHRLAETLVALDGAAATLSVAAADPGGPGAGYEPGQPGEPGGPGGGYELGALLGKAAAGQAALTASRHCQQVLGGMGFTAEHPFHRHAKRALVLDGLLGSARELTREAGAVLRRRGAAPRLAEL